MKIPIEKIIPNPAQPRKEFDMVDLAELAASIRTHNLINPIAVEQVGDAYILVDGERRWRAAKIIGMQEIEANILPGSNGNGSERLVKAIVGNVQRVDMNPVDTAMAYKKLVALGNSVPDISLMINKNTSLIYRYLSILDFPKEIQDLIRTGKLGNVEATIKALKDIPDKNLQIRVAQIAAERGLSGQQVVALVRRMKFAQHKRSHHKEEIKPVATYDGHWNMIAQAGINPDLIHPVLRTSAEATCKECILYNDANKSTCKDCPAVVLLKKVFTDMAFVPPQPQLFPSGNGVK